MGSQLAWYAILGQRRYTVTRTAVKPCGYADGLSSLITVYAFQSFAISQSKKRAILDYLWQKREAAPEIR